MPFAPDQHFSTFAVGGQLESSDIIVGLRGGINTQFTWSGGLPPGVVVPISQGGTSATNAADARTNLGLGTMAIQNANAVDITGGTAALDSGQVAAVPVNPTDIANKAYVDGAVSGAVTSVTGTANQVLVNSTSGTPETGALTLTLPQDIATSSNPTFKGLLLIDTVGSATEQLFTYHVASNLGCSLYLNRSRSTVPGVFTAVQNNDQLGQMTFAGDDGTSFVASANIFAAVSGSVSTGIVPTSLYLQTMNTSGALITGLTISPAQLVTVSSINAGNLNLTGNTISSTAGNINLIPNGAGFFNVGTTTTLNSGLMTIAENSLAASLSIGAFINNASGPTLYFNKSRNTTVASNTAVQSNDVLMNLSAYASDGAAFQQSTQILSLASGTVSSGIVPSLMGFWTTNSSGVLTQGLQIDNAQHILGSSSIQATAGLISGLSAGGTAGNLILYSPTTAKGYLEFLAVNNAANYGVVISNASYGQASTLLIPDVGASSGSFIMNTNVAGTQNIATNITTLNITSLTGNIISGTAAGVQGSVAVYSPTASKGLINYTTADNAANYTITVKNASFGQSSTLSYPDPGASTANFILSAATGTQTIGSALSVSGNFTPSQTNGIVGTTTNNNANAGSVGEFISSTVTFASPTTISTATATNLTSISLSAGDWIVTGSTGYYDAGGTATVTNLRNWISTTSATLPATELQNAISYGTGGLVITGGANTFNAQNTRISLASPATVYIQGYAVFGVAASLTFFGTIYARRVR